MGPKALGIPAQGPRPIIVLLLKYSDPVFEVTPHGTLSETTMHRNSNKLMGYRHRYSEENAIRGGID